MNDMTPTRYVVDDYLTMLYGLKHWQDKIQIALDKCGNAHSFDDVVRLVIEKKVGLFLYPDCVVIMEVIEYPQYSVFHCFIGAGDLTALLGKIEAMHDIARNMGCKYLSFAGRRGWTKAMPDGWTPICTTMYKEV